MQRKQFSVRPTRVALFVTCMADMIYPDVGMATVELLERHGVQVVFPEEQTCCGQPALNAGYRDDARTLARRFLAVFAPLVETGQVDALVAPSGSCVATTSRLYPLLFAESSGTVMERQQAEALARVTFELTEFLVDVLGVQDLGAHFCGKMTYHPCCQLLRELEVDQQPRALLAQVADAELVPLSSADECCGFGGLFALQNAPLSVAMGRRKVHHLERSQAQVAVMCDLGCMAHINGLLTREGSACRAVHIAELLTGRVALAAGGDSSSLPTPAPRRWQDPRQEDREAAEPEAEPEAAPEAAPEAEPVAPAHPEPTPPTEEPPRRRSGRLRRWQELPKPPDPATQRPAPLPSSDPDRDVLEPELGRGRRWQDISQRQPAPRTLPPARPVPPVSLPPADTTPPAAAEPEPQSPPPEPPPSAPSAPASLPRRKGPAKIEPKRPRRWQDLRDRPDDRPDDR